MQTCQPDMYEYQLAAEIEHQFASQGAKSPAYATLSVVGKMHVFCITPKMMP